MDPGDIRAAVLDYVARHERDCPGEGGPGSPCWRERCNLIAFFMHSLGLRGPARFRAVSAFLAEYDLNCADPFCKHEAN